VTFTAQEKNLSPSMRNPAFPKFRRKLESVRFPAKFLFKFLKIGTLEFHRALFLIEKVSYPSQV
jgi:hypothetical protein